VSRFAQGNTVPIDPADGGFVLLLLAIAVVGLAPLCEELFFRALLFRGLRGFWGLTPSLFASGVLFGAFHLNVGVLLPFTLIGVLFAWSNEQSGSIYTSIAAHGAVNSLSFVLTASGALP
jgi:membrane protease YdiL (CAAX protease family)